MNWVVEISGNVWLNRDSVLITMHIKQFCRKIWVLREIWKKRPAEFWNRGLSTCSYIWSFNSCFKKNSNLWSDSENLLLIIDYKKLWVLKKANMGMSILLWPLTEWFLGFGLMFLPRQRKSAGTWSANKLPFFKDHSYWRSETDFKKLHRIVFL